MELGYIYGLHLAGSNRIRYVGQTVRPTLRFTRHKTDAFCDGDHWHYPIYRWIRKYGKDRIEMTILETVPLHQIDEAEIRWIALYRSKEVRLLNVTDGGNCPSRGVKLSAETRRKLSESGKGKIISPEAREKIRQARLGTKTTGTALENHRAAHQSLEFRAKMKRIHAERTPEERTAIALKIWESRRANGK
jgi:group I intron endonuclease